MTAKPFRTSPALRRPGKFPLRIGIFALLLLLRSPVAADDDEAPDPSDLLQQAVQQIANFNADRYTEAQKRDLARYIPAGESREVTLVYRILKPAPAEDLEVPVLEDIYPGPVQHLEWGVEYRQETATIVGRGDLLKDGAPPLPAASDHPQVGMIEWNEWRRRSQEWRDDRRRALPPEDLQVHESQETLPSRAGLEPPEDTAGAPFTPRVDAEWLRRSETVTKAMATGVWRDADPRALAAYGMLTHLESRVAGPAWAPAPEPGGILLSRRTAAAIGASMAVERMGYDRATGLVVVEGKRSAVGIDGDLLATTLRLAYGTEEIPYFSLDPTELADEAWFAERTRICAELRERFGSDPDLAERFHALAFEVTDHAGGRNRIAFLDALDPALAREVSRRLPMTMQLVFRPRWLARTRLGEILFLADQTLKELWYGAAVWSHAPARTLRVPGHIPPKLWEEPEGEVTKMLEEALGRPLHRSTGSRWWFTPGGEALAGDRVVDLSQVQPVLQTERIGGSTKITWSIAGIPGTEQTFETDPIAAALEREDPWTRSVVDDVTRRFGAYAAEIREWEALRQIFRAWVFAQWLREHDPDAGRRFLAELPAPQPASRPLPATWPDQRIVVARLAEGSDPTTVEVADVSVYGGIGFEQPGLRAHVWVPPIHVARSWAANGPAFAADATRGRSAEGSEFLQLALPGRGAGRGSGAVDLRAHGLLLRLPDEEAGSASAAGYAVWREELLRAHGLGWAWWDAVLGRDVGWFAGLAVALGLLTWLRARREGKLPWLPAERTAAVVDLASTTLVFALVATHESYAAPGGTYTGYGAAIAFYALILGGADRIGRFLLTAVVLTVALVWTAWDPGIDELVLAWTPTRLAVPLLPGVPGQSLPADVVYTLAAGTERLPLCLGTMPRLAWLPVGWALACLGLTLEWFADRGRQGRATAAGAGAGS